MWEDFVAYWYSIDWGTIVAIWMVTGVATVLSWWGGTWHGERIAAKIIAKREKERELAIRNEPCKEEREIGLKMLEKEKCLKKKKCSKGAKCNKKKCS